MSFRMPPTGESFKVCVTGGAGFIGTGLVQRFLSLGYHVAVLDDLSSGTRAPVETPRLRFVQGSVLDSAAIDEATSDSQLIVHLAGVVGMRLATEQRERSYRVAVEGTRLLLERTANLPVMMASSSAVYGLTDNVIAQESLGGPEERTLTYDGGAFGYATGKWHMEEIARDADRPILCIRPFNVVGPGQVSAWGMVVPSFIDNAFSGKPLVIYDNGEQSRSFSSLSTFTDVLVRVMRTTVAWSLPDCALNVGASASTSILSLAKLVKARAGSSSLITHLPYAAVFPNRTDVRARVPDSKRLESLIGPVSWPSIESIVDELVAMRRQ
jgi:UDP-glucose 4-epimerase